MIITAAASEGLRDACNHLAMCLSFSEADASTYSALNWQDDQGNLYAACSFPASDDWIKFAQSSLVRPQWDTSKIIDVTAAELAQASIIFWLASEESDPPKATLGSLTIIGGMDGVHAISAMGLTMVPQEEQLP